MGKPNLREKTVTGAGWSFADSILGQGITFVVGIVLANILSPDEYGLIGIITIFITVFNSIVDSGFSNALIRKQDVSEEDYSTMFITNLVLSVFLFFVLFFSAGPISRFFGREELFGLVRVMALVIVINAFSIIQYTVLTKRLDFKTKTKASLISAVVSGIIGIGMAIGGCGVWSLVGQQISRQLIYSILLWIFNKWVPSLTFSVPSFRYMWGFGWKLLLSGILNNLWNELAQVVVGKFYSVATLGQYTRAKEYARLFSANLTSVVQRVSFPALSELQNEKERMVQAYRKVIRVTMYVTATCMFFLGAVSEPLLYCLIGDQWHQAALYLPLICLSMSLYPLHSINLNMLQIQGRSDIFLILEIIKKFLALIPLTLGALVGIYWMLIASVLVGWISFFLNSFYTGKSLGYTSWMQLKDIAPDFGLASCVALAVYFLKYLPLSNWVILPIQLVVGASVFFLTSKAFKMEEYSEVSGLIQLYYSKFRNKNGRSV